MKLKEFIEILKNERIDKEAEVNYVIVYNPYKNYIRFEAGGGVMETEISKQDAIKYLERKSFPGWDACSDEPTVSLSDVEYLINLIYSQEVE